MQCKYKEKVVYAGDMIFGTVYGTFRKAGKRRGKFRETSDVQARNNARRAENKLTEMIHANFDRHSAAVSLTYDEGWYPESEERFDKDIRNYIARVKRLYKKADAECKYIIIKAFGEKGRCHLHIIFSGGVDRDDLESAWEYGRTNADRLQFNAQGVIDLSKYLADQRHAGKRRWSGSKNLVKPIEKTNEHRYSKRELMEIMDSGNPHKFFSDRYAGYWLSEFPEVQRNPINGSYYMTFVMYRPDSPNLESFARKRGKKRE